MSIDPLRQRSHSFSITRPFYPLHHPSSVRSRGLPAIIEDRPQTSDGLRNWDTFSLLRPGQMSPTFSAQYTSASTNWFNHSRQYPLSRKDVLLNIERLEHLVKMSRVYEESLRAVSDASMQFAQALEDFSKARELVCEDEAEGEEDLVEGFRSLSGYQYYTGSQQRVLAQAVNLHCTAPLEAQLEAYRNTLFDLQKSFSKELTIQTTALKSLEKHHLNYSRSRKSHDLSTYRKSLESLTHNLDLLDQLKYEHYETVAGHTRKVWRSVLKRTTLAARVQVDVLERVAERGVVNDCLGRMVVGVRDPWEVKPEGIVEGITRMEVVQTLSSPMNEQGGSIQSHEDGYNCEPEPIHEQHHPAITAPTAPTPHSKTTDTFDDLPDDVPSIHSVTNNKADVQADQLSLSQEVDILKIPSDIPITMTPPLTPPTIITKVDVEGYEGDGGSPRLFTRLGGYGWRG